jgi:hypothetical protein
MPAETQHEMRQEPLKLTWIDETSLYVGKEGEKEKVEDGKKERKGLVKEESGLEENKRCENEERSAKIDAIRREDVKEEEMDEHDGDEE